MTTATKTLRWPEFAAMSPEEKDERFRRRFYDEFVCGVCNRFTEEITPEMVDLVGLFWRGTRFQCPGKALVVAAEGQEELLRHMRYQPELFFGRKNSKGHWEPGLMALWKDYFDRRYGKGNGAITGDTREIDGYLIRADLRGKTKLDVLSFLHANGPKGLNEDWLEKRVERLFG